MSDHPLWLRSSRTGVVSMSTGKSPPSPRRISSGRTRTGWSSAWPTRNIHWLPRLARTLRRTWSLRVWNASWW